MRAGIWSAGAAALLVAACFAPGASAAVVVGAAPHAAYCPGPVTMVQDGTAGSPAYASPVTGVIVYWAHSFYSPDETARLQVLRRTADPAAFLVVAQSALKGVLYKGFGDFEESPGIPIAQGDLLGLSGTTSGLGCSAPPDAAAGDQARATQWGFDEGSDPAVGSTLTMPNVLEDKRVNVAARIEPDADRDGYGDESQDACPSDASERGRCRADLSVAVAPSPARVTAGAEVSHVLDVVNHSTTGPAHGVVVTHNLDWSETPVSASTSRGRCELGRPVRCTLGDLPPGASARVSVVARANEPKTVEDTARVGSDSLDSNQANNAATSTVVVDRAPPPPPPAPDGVAIRRQALAVGTAAPVTVACLSRARDCAGSLRLVW